MGIAVTVYMFWPRLQTMDKAKASELAKKLLKEPVKLPTRNVMKDGDKRRVIAWDVAGPAIQNEARLIAASLAYWHAEELDLGTVDEDETIALGRKAALWWHGFTEDDVPDDY